MNLIRNVVGIARNICAATVLLLLGVPPSYADAPIYLWGNVSWHVPVDMPNALSVCQLYTPTQPGDTFDIDNVVTNVSARCVLVRGTQRFGLATTYAAAKCADGSAPDTSKPWDQRCRAPNCPATGTPAGYENVTTGWSNGPSVTSKIVVRVIPDGGSGVPGSISQVVDGCVVSNTGGPPAMCYQAQEPSSTGLYRISCDLPMQYTGSSGTQGSGAPGTDNGANQPPPACPGSAGTVNGKPVCLDSPSSQPNNTAPQPNQGNPAPGSSPPYNPNATSPNGTTSGQSDGSGSAGGQGTSQTNPASSPRTSTPATDANVGTGSGGGGTTPGETGPKECGTPGRPKCQIDETGTPDGSSSADGKGGAFSGAKTALDQGVQTVQDGANAGASDTGKDTSIGWVPALPSGSCVNPSIPNYSGQVFEVDICQYTGYVTAGFEALWAIFFAFAAMGLVSSATAKS